MLVVTRLLFVVAKLRFWLFFVFSHFSQSSSRNTCASGLKGLLIRESQHYLPIKQHCLHKVYRIEDFSVSVKNMFVSQDSGEGKLSRKNVLGISFVALLLIMIASAISVQPVKAGLIIVPDDYPTIQAAINNATEGDRIFVRNGTYPGSIAISKTLTLEGENRNATIIDGGTNEPSGSIVLVTADNVKISGFTIQHCRAGGNAIWLDGYVNMTFSHNIITGCNEGVRIFNSSGTVVSDNIVQNCYYNTGVGFDYGFDNTVYRNTIIHNHCGISGGIDCHGNTYSENTIINNDIGFGTTSYDSKFFHNNFVDNGVKVIATGVNQFDDGYPSGGNYWSDYSGTDLFSGLYQNESCCDGIGDSSYVIDSNNNDGYPLIHPYGSICNLDSGLTYLTIQSAINAPETLNEHTIFVRNGTYYENVVVNKSLSIIGQNRETTIVDGNGTGTVVYIVSDNTKITGFTIRSSGSSYNPDGSGDSGVFANCVKDCSISGNDVLNNGVYGVLLWHCSGSYVSCNLVSFASEQESIRLGYSYDCEVSNNTVTYANYVGIEVDNSPNCRILDNAAYSNGLDGIYLLNSPNSIISDNDVHSNEYGGIGIQYSNSVNINGNTVYSHYGSNIDLTSSNCCIVTDNIAKNSLWNDGISLSWSSNNVISCNEICSNGRYGISIWTSPNNNKIFHNSFTNNGMQTISQGTNTWDDDYPSGGNYWSNYNGTDSNSDGIGDSPYVIDANNQDNYPLMSPWTPPDIEVSNVTSKTVMGLGFTARINVTAVDRGAKVEGFNITVYANSTPIQMQSLILSSGNSATAVFTWNTTGFAYGNYTLSAYAEPLLGEANTTNNRFTYGIIHVTIPGDFNGDFKVGPADFALLSAAYGSTPSSPKWNPNCDVNGDESVGPADFAQLSAHYGQHYP